MHIFHLYNRSFAPQLTQMERGYTLEDDGEAHEPYLSTVWALCIVERSGSTFIGRLLLHGWLGQRKTVPETPDTHIS